MILKDPAVESLSSFIGVDGTNTTLNAGRIQINLKPLADRRCRHRSDPRLQHASVKNVDGITLYMQPVQDISVEDIVSRTEYQYSLQDPNADELGAYVAKFLERLKQLPQLADVASDLQTQGPAVGRSNSTGQPPRGSESRRRTSTTRSTTASASARSRRCSPSSTSIT